MNISEERHTRTSIDRANGAGEVRSTSIYRRSNDWRGHKLVHTKRPIDEDVDPFLAKITAIAVRNGERCGAQLAIHRRVFKAMCLFVSIAAGASCTAQPQTIAADSPPAGTAADHSAHTSEAHGNHDPHHGGVVYMKDNLHFEIVFTREGTHRVYFSDAARAALPASTASEVTVSFSNGEERREILKADVDEAGESWVLKGAVVPKEETSARLTFVVDSEPYWIDVPFIEAAPDTEPR